ncbi:MAG: ATP-binding protein [Actinomycetota bacterium]|nr:ATP-binding protein [Actinomycetota bacterium]
MSQLDDRSPGAISQAAELGPLAFIDALAEMMPTPIVVYAGDGRITLVNRPAEHLLVAAPDRLDRRVLTFDGMDLWELITSKSKDAASFFTIEGRIRTATSRSEDTSFVVAPLATGHGAPGGAIVFAYDSPDERDGAALHPHPLDASAGAEDVSFLPILRLLVERLGADGGVLAEIEPDRPTHGNTLAAVLDGEILTDFQWEMVGTPATGSRGRRAMVQANGLLAAYPDDSWAAKERFESYVGTYLFDEYGGRVGVLGVYSRDPIESPAIVRGMVRLFAARIAPSLRHLRAERDLRESEERYSALFEDSHLPIMLVDPVSTQILDANNAACAFYGHTHEDLTTMSVMQINTLDPDDVRKELSRAADGTRDYFQFHHRLADGSVRDVEVYSGPIAVHGRQLLYTIIHDVTERHHAASELERYKKELERLLRRRTDDLMKSNAELQQTTIASESFYENVGLELRTPLHTIIGFSDLMSRGMAGPLNDEQQVQTNMILDAGRTLAALLDDVLELSRLDTGVERCDPEQFDVGELIDSVALGIRPVAEERGLRLEVRMPQDVSLDAYTDRNKLEQIILQLLSNALKYTTAGTVTIEATYAEDECVITVSDTGVGIESAELPHIFEEFRQVTRQSAGTHEGTGLGLAVSKRLAGVLQGSISVKSEPGRGAAFTLRIPLRCS